MSAHRYADDFFDYVEVSARNSARCVVAALRGGLTVRSVLDVGCGRGAWVAEWIASGIDDAVGLDGEYVDPRRLAVPPSHFRAQDVSQAFDLGRRFDLVQSLEVAEHLPPQCSEVFVDNLTRHSENVLFSAAVPGQGGEYHVNERSYEYWRALFRQQEYDMYDCVRPLVRNLRDVDAWYRYNSFLFTHRAHRDRLPPAIRALEIPYSRRVPDIAPWTWTARNWVLRRLPRPAVDRLAILKHRAVNAAQRRKTDRRAGLRGNH